MNRTHLIAANSTEPTTRERAFFVAGNIAPIEPDAEWLMLSPYGEFPHPLGLQKVNKAAAEKMVAAFNSLSSRLARAFRGLPIYIGHPDVDPERWPDDRRVGSVRAVEAREDGFFAKVAWNSLGKENAEQGFHVFPSPAWLFPKNPRGVIEPDELISVGLTNTPQIRDVPPWTNAQPAGDPGTTTTTMTPEERKALCLALGIADTSTNDEITAAANALKTSAEGVLAATNSRTAAEQSAATEKQRADTLATQLTAANAATVAANTAHAKTLLDAATTEGRITPTQRAEYETAFNSDFAAAAARLATEKKQLNTKELEIGGTRVAINTAADRKRIIDEAVAAAMSKNGGNYDAAWNSVKRDPKFAPLFAAMERKEGN